MTFPVVTLNGGRKLSLSEVRACKVRRLVRAGWFNSIDPRFSGMDARFTNLKANMNNRFNNLEARFDTLTGKTIEIDNRLTRVEAILERH